MLIPCDDNEEKLLTSRDSIRKQLPVPCDCSTIIVLVLLVYTSLDNSQHSLRYNTRYLSSLFSFIRFLSFFFFFHSFIFNSLMHLIAYNMYTYLCTYVQKLSQITFARNTSARSPSTSTLLSFLFTFDSRNYHFDRAFLASQR